MVTNHARWLHATYARHTEVYVPMTTPTQAQVEAAGFRQYRRSQIAELRPYIPGESMDGVSISAPDKDAGSPKQGDMIARNPKNHADKWLVVAQYFADNFEPLTAAAEVGDCTTEIITQHAINIEAATIERCAQVAKNYPNCFDPRDNDLIAFEIMSLKDKPCSGGG